MEATPAPVVPPLGQLGANMSIRSQCRPAGKSIGHLSGPSRYGLLFSAALGAFGRNGYFLTASWILAERGYGSAGVAIFLAIVSATEFILSPVAGWLADRFDRRRLQAVADLGRFIVSLATPSALSNVAALPAICMSAVLFSFCDRVALTASQSMIPAIVADRDSAIWNSIVVLVMQTGNFGAALLIGMLLSGHASAVPFAVLAASFLFAAIMVASTNTSTASRGCRPQLTTVLEVKPGFRQLVVAYAFFYASAVLFSVLGSSFVFAELKGTASDFGVLEAAWSIGSLLGAVSLAAVRPRISADRQHLWLLGTIALMFITLRHSHAPWTTLLFASVGFLYNLGRVSVEVAFQSRVAAASLGRAKGVMHSVAVALSLMVFAVVAAVGDRAVPSTIFFGFGLIMLIGISVLTVFHRQPQEKGKS